MLSEFLLWTLIRPNCRTRHTLEQHLKVRVHHCVSYDIANIDKLAGGLKGTIVERNSKCSFLSHLDSEMLKTGSFLEVTVDMCPLAV